MIEVMPISRFTGYPDRITAVEFQPGVPVTVSREYAAILSRKGLILAPKAKDKAPDKAS